MKRQSYVKTVSSRLSVILCLAVWGTLGLFASGGCARVAADSPTLSATATATPEIVTGQPASRLAVAARAEREARDVLLDKVSALDSGRGMKLGELAIIDASVKAILMDSVRDAKIVDKTIDPSGATTITIQMQMDPIDTLIAHYPQHAQK